VGRTRRNWWIVLLGLFALTTVLILVIAIFNSPTVQQIGSFVGILWWLLLLSVLGIGYFKLSKLVGAAAERKGRSSQSWTLIALFFGLFIPAIVVAVMGPGNGPNGRACSYCAEEIQPAAVKCKHCGSSLVSNEQT